MRQIEFLKRKKVNKIAKKFLQEDNEEIHNEICTLKKYPCLCKDIYHNEYIQRGLIAKSQGKLPFELENTQIHYKNMRRHTSMSQLNEISQSIYAKEQ